ncbi:hypothetical protein F66182_8443 [Fusarium sp. NRRL 66182]|nr:hypothetical protein F66182_8443 [Fusarium sp. NRRL 66182]
MGIVLDEIPGLSHRRARASFASGILAHPQRLGILSYMTALLLGFSRSQHQREQSTLANGSQTMQASPPQHVWLCARILSSVRAGWLMSKSNEAAVANACHYSAMLAAPATLSETAAGTASSSTMQGTQG